MRSVIAWLDKQNKQMYICYDDEQNSIPFHHIVRTKPSHGDNIQLIRIIDRRRIIIVFPISFRSFINICSTNAENFIPTCISTLTFANRYFPSIWSIPNALIIFSIRFVCFTFRMYKTRVFIQYFCSTCIIIMLSSPCYKSRIFITIIFTPRPRIR